MFASIRLFRAATLGLALVVPALTSPVSAQDTKQTTAPDNSGKNTKHANTANADKQSQAAGDIDITKKIRRAVVADKSLSMYAHNVKIITMNGAVTLKGPVKSDDEKKNVEAKAVDVVGQDKVTDQITVKQ